jgi:hypothetical protein
MRGAPYSLATTNNSLSSKDPSCHIGSLPTLAPLLATMWLRAAAAAATAPLPREPSRTISFSGAAAPHKTAYCACFIECVHAKIQRQMHVMVNGVELNAASERTHKLMASAASTTT